MKAPLENAKALINSADSLPLVSAISWKIRGEICVPTTLQRNMLTAKMAIIIK